MRKFLTGAGVVFLILVVALAILFTASYFYKRSAVEYIDPVLRLFDSDRYEVIYTQETSQQFRNVSDEKAFVELLASVRSRLGKVQKRNLNHWRINFQNLSPICVLVYTTAFQKGGATETFTLTKEAGTWKIQGYYIKG